VRRPTHAERAEAREAVLKRKDKIIKRYEAGEPLFRMARSLGVSETWLRLRLDDWGVPRRPRHAAHRYRRAGSRVFRGRTMTRRTTAEVQAAQTRLIERRQEVTERYREGESAAALAREFIVDPGWLRKRLDEWGVPRRDRSTAAVVRGPGVPPL
jgi:hypothetical protein